MSLSTRLKRRKGIRDEYVEQDALIFRLPDETLLSIFKYFKINELILAAGLINFFFLINLISLVFFSSNSVCRWFRSIVYDDEFWTTIDLTKSFPNKILLKFLRRFPRDCTEVLKISGDLLHNNSGKPPPFTEQLSTVIRTSYPNLRYLHIKQYDFHPDQTTVNNITYLPSKLQGLYLKKCEMLTGNISGRLTFLQLPLNPLKNSTPDFSLRQLEIFSLENCSCLVSEQINYLPNLCPKLVELNLNGCFRIKSTILNTLILYSDTLRRLYLSETQITDDTIHTICRKLKRLNILNIKSCKHITINIVENLLTLKQLQILIANDDIQNIYNQKKNDEKL